MKITKLHLATIISSVIFFNGYAAQEERSLDQKRQEAFAQAGHHRLGRGSSARILGAHDFVKIGSYLRNNINIHWGENMTPGCCTIADLNTRRIVWQHKFSPSAFAVGEPEVDAIARFDRAPIRLGIAVAKGMMDTWGGFLICRDMIGESESNIYYEAYIDFNEEDAADIKSIKIFELEPTFLLGRYRVNNYAIEVENTNGTKMSFKMKKQIINHPSGLNEDTLAHERGGKY